MELVPVWGFALVLSVTSSVALADGSHQLSLKFKSMQDQTMVRQSLRGPSFGYEFRRDFSVPVVLSVDVENLTGDQRLRVYRLAAGSDIKPFKSMPVNVTYGLSYYLQKIRSPAADSTDQGGQLYIGAQYRPKPWLELGITYHSVDIEGSDPDDPGDYIELPRLEFTIFASSSDADISVGLKYADVGNDCAFSMLIFRWEI